MPDGRLGHAEIEIGGALIMLADEFPEIGHTAPLAGSGASVTLHLSVDSVDGVDSVIERAVASGAVLLRAAEDYPHGRQGSIRDPFGHRWLISQEPTSTGSFREGDLGYVSLNVPSVARADRFFESVLGWRYGPASGPEGRQVQGFSLHHGLWTNPSHSTLFCCYAVDDADEAAIRVRDAGGRAGQPHDEPYGRVCDCTDDQGVEFALFTPPGGTVAEGSPAPHAIQAQGKEGELVYLTMEVPVSSKTRNFYGAVLGWRFAPGNVDDGWQVEAVSPMIGISGGHEVATTLPMYRVAEIAAAVGRVREAGGTASEPETHPYGITSDCTDDQGTRFYLGQL
jgi:predicted enzyme related to lactoylglutathione lyase